MGFERSRLVGTFPKRENFYWSLVMYNELVSTNSRNFDEFFNVQTKAPNESWKRFPFRDCNITLQYYILIEFLIKEDIFATAFTGVRYFI